MSPGSAVDLPGYYFPTKMLCIHKLKPHQHQCSNNLAHTVNDTLSLSLAVLSKPGPSCSKLTMSLVNDSLKFTSSDMQIC